MKKVKDVDIVFKGDLSDMEKYWKPTEPVYMGTFSLEQLGITKDVIENHFKNTFLMGGVLVRIEETPHHKTDNQHGCTRA